MNDTNAIDERQGLPSASSIERLMLCPGSWQLERQIPESEPGRAALEGTLLHEVLAGGRSDDMLNERQQWIVSRCRSLVTALADRLGFDRADEGLVELREERIWFTFDEGEPAFSGQVDLALIDGTRGLVVDYKTGVTPVAHISENYQMRCQAVLVARAHRLDEVYVAIVQPLVDEPVAVARYGAEELRLAELDLMQGLALAHEAAPPRTPGARQCRYCRARPICPEGQGAALAVVPPDMVALPTSTRQLPTLTPAQLAELLPKADLAEEVIREVRRQAREALKNDPSSIPGFRLKEGGERRSIGDAEQAFEKLSGVIDARRFAACCTVQIGKLEAAYRDATGRNARQAKEELSELLGDILERKRSEASLEAEQGGRGTTGQRDSGTT